MADTSFTFCVEVYRDGALLESTVASLGPCIEDALWQGVLAGRFSNDGIVPPLRAVPLWAASGSPEVAGVRLETAGETAGQYDLSIFTPQAQAVIRNLLVSKVLTDKERVQWGVVAVSHPATEKRRFRTRLSRAPYPLQTGVLPDAAAGEVSTVFEAGVLDAIRETIVASYPREVAGLLIGEMLFDPERRAVELAIRDQLPVTPGAGGSSAGHFSFGPESFLAARAAADTLKKGFIAGWWHSHPPCNDCVAKASCVADFVFFSADDHQVQASAFPAAYAVALVGGKVGDRPASDPGFRLYAWQRGNMAERTWSVRQSTVSHSERFAAATERGKEAST